MEEGQILGRMVVRVGEEERQTIPIVAEEAVARITIPGIFLQFLSHLFMAA